MCNSLSFLSVDIDLGRSIRSFSRNTKICRLLKFATSLITSSLFGVHYIVYSLMLCSISLGNWRAQLKFIWRLAPASRPLVRTTASLALENKNENFGQPTSGKLSKSLSPIYKARNVFIKKKFPGRLCSLHYFNVVK